MGDFLEVFKRKLAEGDSGSLSDALPPAGGDAETTAFSEPKRRPVIESNRSRGKRTFLDVFRDSLNKEETEARLQKQAEAERIADEAAAAKGKENIAKRSEFTRGLLRGIDQTQATFYGGLGMLSSAMGDDKSSDMRFQQYREQMRQASENPATVDEFFSTDPKKGAFGSVGNLGTYAAGTIGSLLPTIAESAVAGVAGAAIGGAIVPAPDPTDVVAVPVGFVGGVLGRGAMKKAIAETAERYVARGVAAEAAQQMGERAVKNALAKRIGATIGTQQITALQEGGGMYAEGREAGYDNPWSAILFGQASGASEGVLGNVPFALRTFIGKTAVREAAQKFGTKEAAGLLWDAVKNAGEEAVQESFQEFLGDVNSRINDPNDKIFTKENFKQWAESGAAGALAGGILGGGGVATQAALDARRRQLEELRAKGFISKEEAKDNGIEGSTRREIMGNAEQELADLNDVDALAKQESDRNFATQQQQAQSPQPQGGMQPEQTVAGSQVDEAGELVPQASQADLDREFFERMAARGGNVSTPSGDIVLPSPVTLPSQPVAGQPSVPQQTPASFAARMARGEQMTSPEDQQYRINNAAEIEAELQKLMSPTDTATAPPAEQPPVQPLTDKEFFDQQASGNVATPEVPPLTPTAGDPFGETTPPAEDPWEQPEEKEPSAQSKVSDDTYKKIREVLRPANREDLQLAVPYLRVLYPEYASDLNDPWGIGRAVQQGSELPRVPTADLSRRIRDAISSGVLSEAGDVISQEPSALTPEQQIQSDREFADRKAAAEINGKTIEQMRNEGMSEDEIQEEESKQNYFNVIGDVTKASDKDLNRAYGFSGRLVDYHERKGQSDMAESVRREQESMKAEIKRRNAQEDQQPDQPVPPSDIASAESDMDAAMREEFKRQLGEKDDKQPPKKRPPRKDGKSKKPSSLKKSKGKARKEADNLWDELIKKSQNKLLTGLDPELLTLAAKIAIKELEYSAISFAEFVERSVAKVPDTLLEKLKPYLESAWRTAYDSEMTTDAGGKFDDYIKKPEKSRPKTDELQGELRIPVAGQPFTFTALHNKEKSPDMGSRFGQDKEPAGRYVVAISDSNTAAADMPDKFDRRTVTFQNPLVIEFGGGYQEASNWKQVLSGRYGGLTGKALSQAIVDDGFDGIVTVEPAKGANRPAHTSEIVDLSTIKAEGKPSKPAPAESDIDKTLRQAGLKVEQLPDGTWQITGNTYEHSREIGDAKREVPELKGWWDSRLKRWTFKRDPRREIADRIASKTTGDESVDDEGSDEQMAREDARREQDATPDIQRSGEDYVASVDQSTKDLVARGLRFGMTQEVVDNQIEDIGRVVVAAEENLPMFVIGSAPGTGKTFVLGGVIRELRRRGFKKFVYVTQNENLITQVQGNLADYGLDGVEFTTYAKSREKPLDTSGAVLLLDEAHTAKNGDRETGKKISRMVKASTFTVYATATPFENVSEAEYLGYSGIFDGLNVEFTRPSNNPKRPFRNTLSGFDAWAWMFGAKVFFVKRTADNGETYVVPVVWWDKHQTAEEDQFAANDWLKKRGVYVQRPMSLPVGTVKSEMRSVEADPYWADISNRVVDIYDEAESQAESGQEKGQIKAHKETVLKRLLELAKVDAAIARTKEIIGSGREDDPQVIIFVNYKSDLDLGTFELSKPYREHYGIKGKEAKRRYSPSEMDEMMRVWYQAKAMSKQMGESAGPPPFAPFIHKIAMVMDEAGLLENFPSVIDKIMDAFPGQAVEFSGRSGSENAGNLAKWKNNEAKLIVATMHKGGTGLSFHDTTGKMPSRYQVNMTLPWSGTQVEQVSGRLARYGTAKPVNIEWIFASNIPFDRRLSKTVGSRMRSMSAAVQGTKSGDAKRIMDFDFLEDQETGVGEESPWLNASVEDENRWAGTTVNISAKGKEEGYAGTVVRVLNKGETIEVQRDGFDSAIRVPAERVSVINLVDSKAGSSTEQADKAAKILSDKDPYAESSPESQQRRKDINEAWSDMRSYYQLDPDSTVEVGLRDMIDGFVSGDSKPPRVAGNPDGKAYEYTGSDKRLNAIKKRAQTVANKTSAVQAVVVVGNVNTGVPTHAVIVSSPGFVGSEYNPQDSKHFAWVNSLEKLYPGMVVDVVVPTEKKIGRKDTGASEIKPRDRFIDSAGQEWEAYSSRGGVVIAHPVVDDKPQVNRDSQASFAVTDAAKSRHPEYKTDIVSVTKWKGEETPVSKEKQEDEKEKSREGERSGQGPMGQDRRAIPEYGVKGKSASVITADKSTRRATYYAVEADSLIPSHDARKNFAKNEGSLENERPYEDPKEGADSRQTVRSIAEVDKEKRYLLTSDTMSPTDGPPIVDLYGRVLGGNARSMGMQLAYAGPNADVLRSHMRAEGAKFEIPQEQLDALNNPVIIRVMEEPFDENTISSLLNESLAAAKSQATVVVSQSKRLSEETIDLVASILGAETEPSLREVMANPRQSTRIVQAIVRDGAWSDKDIAVYVDPGTGDLTAEGKLAIENMLVARVIPNVSLLGDVAPAVKQKILSAIGPLTKGLASEKFGEQMLGDLVAAIEAYDGYIAERKTNSLQSYFFEQKQMFPVPGHGSVTVAGIVHALADFTPTKFRNAMRDVVESLGIGERTPSLFGDDVTYDTIEDAVRNVINPPLRKDNDLLMQLDDRITDPPQSLFQSDPDIDATIRSKALDLGIAANEAGITAFDDFVRYSLKRNGEKLTRYMGAYLAMVGKTVGMTGIRPVKDILGVPMTQAEYVQLGKEAFAGSPQVTPEQVEAGIEAAMLTGLPQMAVGFAPAGTPVPGRKTREVLTQGDFDQPASYKFTERDYRPAVVSYARDKWGSAVAANGKPTWQNFVRWFGDSKVVDKDGEPLVVYHGTASSFESFDLRKVGSATDSGSLGSGFYFSSDPQVVERRQLGMAVYLSLSNPLIIKMPDFKTEKLDLVTSLLGVANTGLNAETSNAIREAAISKGYDGVILDYSPTGYQHREFVVFDSTQIKSATGNRGTFDPNNPNMLYQEGKQVDADTIPKAVLSKMSRRLKSMGYDSRGAEDVRKAIKEKRLLDFQEDWIAAYQFAIGAEQERQGKAAAKKDLKHVNWSRLNQLGETLNPNEAGYIKPDGSLADFSGKQEGGQRGTRSFDHREAGGTAGMQEVIAYGWVRMDENSGSLDIAKMPTPAQLSAITRMAQRKFGEIVLDLEDGLGEWRETDEYYSNPRRRWSQQYPEGTKPQRIVNDIKRFFGGDTPNTLFQQEEAPRWYLKSRKLIQDKMGPKATSEQVLGMLRKNGVNDEELYWSGLEELLSSKQSVTKDEVLAAIGSGVRIEEVQYPAQPQYAIEAIKRLEASGITLERDMDGEFAWHDSNGEIMEDGDIEDLPRNQLEDIRDVMSSGGETKETKYGKFTLPGGKNYKELLITIPEVDRYRQLVDAGYRAVRREGYWQIVGRDWVGVGSGQGNTEEEALRNYAEVSEGGSAKEVNKSYRTGHWDEANVLAHIRFNERTDTDGKRVLFVEEIQSDWHQEGRKKGYVGLTAQEKARQEKLEATDSSEWSLKDIDWYASRVNDAQRDGVPDAPFKKSWPMLAMKRAIQYATENGFDRIAWATGEQQAERYRLSAQVNEISYAPRTGAIYIEAKNGSPVLDGTVKDGVVTRTPSEFSQFQGRQLKDVVGQEIAERLFAESPNDQGNVVLRESDLKVGGEGMKAFYDKMLPNETNKLIKKFGSKVETISVLTEDRVTYDQVQAAERRRDWAEAERLSAIFERQDLGRGDDSIQGEFSASSQMGFDVTPAMRESALQYGQTLFQRQSQGGNVKGWTKFISGTRALIGATNKADISTVIHEYAHVIRRFLLNRDVPQDQRIDITDEEISMLEEKCGVKDGNWDVPAEEKFAKMWEQYFFEGKSPNALLDSLFEKISRWMRQVYLTAMSITGGTLDPEVRDLFDKMVQRQLPADQRTDTRSRDGSKDKPPIYLPLTSDQWGDNLTSLANAAANATRERLKLPSLTEPASEGFQEWLDAAVVLMRNDPTYANRLVKELQQSSRSIDDVDVAVLNLHYRHLKNLSDAAANRLFKAIDDKQGDVAIVQARRESDALINEIEDFTDMTKKVGTEAGRALVARKIALAEDYTLGNLLLKARVANAGQPLSEAQLQEVRELADKIAKLEGDLAKEIQEKDDLARKLAAKESIDDTQKEVGKPVRNTATNRAVKKVENFVSKFVNIFGKRDDTTTLQQTEDEAMAEDGEEVIKSFVEAGVYSFGEFMSKFKAVIKGDVPVAARAALRKAWDKLKAQGDIPAPDMSDERQTAELRRLAKMVERNLVEFGITDPEEVIDGVHEALQEVFEDVTRREAMDAMSGYGQYSTPSQEPVDKIIRDLNAQYQQMAKKDDMQQGVAPKKSGRGRDEPSPELRELIREVNEMKRNSKYFITDPEAQLKTIFQATRTALRNRIYDLNKAIKTKEPIPGRTPNTFEGEQAKEIESLRKQRDELMADYKATFPKPGLTFEQRAAIAERAVDREITKIEQQLASGNVAAKERAEPVSTPALKDKQNRLESLRAQREAVREMQMTDADREQRAERLERQAEKAYVANLLNRIADYEDRKAQGYFGPKPKKEPRTLSPREVELSRQLVSLKDEFFRYAAEYRLRNMGKVERFWDRTKETMHLSRAIMTSFDLSAVFRQGGIASLAHPRLAAAASREMWNALWRGGAEFDTMDKISKDELYTLAMRAGLSITTDSGKITRQEEAYMGRWAKWGIGKKGTKINELSLKALFFVAPSARSYTTFLNSMRFRVFKYMVSNLGAGGEVTIDEAKVIASYVNAATGRAELGKFNQAAANLNTVFFAPRYVASRFQYLAMPFYLLPSTKVSGRVKKMIAMEYARHVMGLTAFLGLSVALASLLTDDEEEKPTVEFDPRSSDFMKLKIGDTRIDPMAGLSQTVTLIGQMATGQKKGLRGDIKDLYGENRKFGDPDLWDVGTGFLRKKLAPIPGAIVDLRVGENVIGEKETVLSATTDLFVPLSFQEAGETMKARGLVGGSVVTALSLLGMGGGTYGPKTQYVTADATKREELFKKDLENVKWNDPDLAYKDFLTTAQLDKFNKQREGRKQSLVFSAAADPKRKDYNSDETFKKSVEERDKALEAVIKAGMGPKETQLLLIAYYKRNYGSAYEVRGGVYRMKESLANRLRTIRRKLNEKKTPAK